MKVKDLVTNAIENAFDDETVNLVDVDYVKQNNGYHLIVFIDKQGGADINDCERISKKIDPIIDELNPTNDEPYFLDVTSYGLDKPLIKDFQLDKYLNKTVVVKLYSKLNGVKEFNATLLGYDNKNYKLNFNEQDIVIQRDKVAMLLPFVEF